MHLNKDIALSELGGGIRNIVELEAIVENNNRVLIGTNETSSLVRAVSSARGVSW